MWIARDKNGSLWIHITKPVRVDDKLETAKFLSLRYEIIPSELYPEVTWENSPKELVVKEDKE